MTNTKKRVKNPKTQLKLSMFPKTQNKKKKNKKTNKRFQKTKR